MQPDVLLLDEVLAVGDASFRHKCYHRISNIISNCAVILVSHSMEQIAAVVDSVGLMHQGTFTVLRNAAEGINAYNEVNEQEPDESSMDGKDFAVYRADNRCRSHHPPTHAFLIVVAWR